MGTAGSGTAGYNQASTNTGYTSSIHTVPGLNGQQTGQMTTIGYQAGMASQGPHVQMVGMETQSQPTGMAGPAASIQQRPTAVNGFAAQGVHNLVGAQGAMPVPPGLNSGMVPGMAAQGATAAMPAQGVPASGQPVQYLSTPQGPSTQAMINAGQLPMTPVAGLGMGMMSAGLNTPGAAAVQPMMMSTPMTGGAGKRIVKCLCFKWSLLG